MSSAVAAFAAGLALAATFALLGRSYCKRHGMEWWESNGVLNTGMTLCIFYWVASIYYGPWWGIAAAPLLWIAFGMSAAALAMVAKRFVAWRSAVRPHE